jgi:hypothetical protein
MPKTYRLLIRGEIKVSLSQCHQKKDLKVAAQRPQTVSPAGSRESTPLDSNPPILDSDLTDFCSRLQITPSIRQFYEDEDDTDPDLCVSDQSSDIEEESELRRFTRALQEAQVIALKEEKKNK